MTPRFRKCELALCPPYQDIFGYRFGVCPLVQECPDTVVCGYAMTRQAIKQLDASTAVSTAKGSE
jgi:hypothetical protein